MRISDLGARTLGVLGAITLLAGCGGGSMGSSSGGFNAIPPHVSAPNPVVPPSPSRLAPLALDRAVAANEVLSADGKRVRVLAYNNDQRGAVVLGASFSASGKASGAYRGTFTASGSWSYTYANYETWSFNENFAIASARGKIAGTVRGGGYCITLRCSFEMPRVLSYTINGAAEKATAKIRKGHFKETLYDLVAAGVQQ
jgi:hypothetical protein